MGNLSKNQIESLFADLDQEGITFEPLRSELADHLISDLEGKMDSGQSFEMAWKSVKSQIPKNHFKHIQKETMEVLNKKFHIVNMFVKFSIALLCIAALFKIMHWPGAATLLMMFMGVSALTILIGSGRSVRVYKEYKVRFAIWSIAILFAAFIVGLCFKFLHLPGANQLMYGSTIGLTLLFSSLSVYFYKSGGTLRNHLLIRLLQDNQTHMKNVALTLIGFGLLMNAQSILVGQQNFVGVVFFMFSIMLVGIYTYALTWKYFVQQSEEKSAVKTTLLIFSTLAFVMFMQPFFIMIFFQNGSEAGFVIRQFAAFGALIIFDVIVCVFYARFSDSPIRQWLAPLSTALVFYPFVRLGIKMEWFEGFLGGLTTNPVFIVGFMILLVGLYLRFRKEPLFASLIILTMTSHMIPTL